MGSVDVHHVTDPVSVPRTEAANGSVDLGQEASKADRAQKCVHQQLSWHKLNAHYKCDVITAIPCNQHGDHQ